MSDRTKSLKKKRNLFGILSFVMFLGTALFFLISAFCKLDLTSPEGIPIFSDELKSMLVGLGTTACIGILGAVIIKDKIRTFLWMVSLVISVILYDQAGMFTVLGIWLTDEYVIHNLFKHYCHLVQINKEIDLRIE